MLAEEPGLDGPEVPTLLSVGVEGVESVGPGEVAGLSLGVWVLALGMDPGLDGTELLALSSEGVKGAAPLGPGEVKEESLGVWIPLLGVDPGLDGIEGVALAVPGDVAEVSEAEPFGAFCEGTASKRSIHFLDIDRL